VVGRVAKWARAGVGARDLSFGCQGGLSFRKIFFFFCRGRSKKKEREQTKITLSALAFSLRGCDMGFHFPQKCLLAGMFRLGCIPVWRKIFWQQCLRSGL